MCCTCLTITLILISMCCKWLTITLILISEHLRYSSDLTEPKYHKTKQLVVWLKQAKINIWNRALKYMFYFTKSLLTRSILSPPGKYLWQKLFSPRHSFFSDSPFSKFGTESCLPTEREGDWYCAIWLEHWSCMVNTFLTTGLFL